MLAAFAQAQDWTGQIQTLFGDYGEIGLQVLKIIWINILLSGDNAVVIAMACRSLPKAQRTIGIVLGAGVAVVLRIIFTVGVNSLMSMPWLKVIGSVLLYWVAIKLLTDEGHDEANVKQSSSVWGAIRTIAIADMVMSLDNVLAIAAAAKGNVWLIVFGLAISSPLIVAGATLIMALLTHLPVLVWAGAALLGWIAGDLIGSDPAALPYFVDAAGRLGMKVSTLEHVVAGLGAMFVVLVGWLVVRMRGEPEKSTDASAAE